jgi:uncharacterized membrane protein HdeD (DUF308 family)
VSDSAEIIAALAREAELQQLSSLDRIDSKAASLIGLAGVALGLLFTARVSADHWNAAMSVGAGLIVLGIIPMAIALLPRRYAFNPNIDALARGWGSAPPHELHEAVYRSISRALAINTENLRVKGFFVRLGVVVIVAGLLCATSGVLYALNSSHTVTVT